jgi:hypothetical protein
VSTKLQQYIISLIENCNTNFGPNSSYEVSSLFGAVYKHGTAVQSVGVAQEYLSLISLNTVLFSFAPDIILYVGIIFLVTQLGYNSKFNPQSAKTILYRNCK